jgi:HlyD family secretion protein
MDTNEPYPLKTSQVMPASAGIPALLRARAVHPVVSRLARLSLAQWIWISAGAALALLLIWMYWPRAQAVDMAVIDRGLVQESVVDEARTRIHDMFVVAAPVSGMLQRITLEQGDAVTRGQVIATIVPAEPALLDARLAAEAQANIAVAQAGVRAADAELDLARSNQARVARLHERGFAAQTALDNANAALRASRFQLQARQAELARARIAVGAPSSSSQSPTRVRSPAAGRVLRLFQQSEGVVGAGAPLLEIGDPSHLEIVAEFLSQDAVLMQPGAAAFVENWGGEGLVPARIFRIEPNARTRISALGVEEQRVNVIAHLESPEQTPPLGNGFRVDLRVVLTEQADALRAPTDALVRHEGGWAVFRIESGRATLTPVELGEGGERYRVVREGLTEGDQVVLFPGDALRSGQRVRAREPAER